MFVNEMNGGVNVTAGKPRGPLADGREKLLSSA